jgi:cytochrome P450
MDAPDHVEYRRITQSSFTRRSLHALQDRVRVVARDCLDRMAGRGGECEFVRDIARPFPLRVMMSILGLPKEDAPHVLALTARFFQSQSTLVGRDPARHASHLRETLTDFMAYFKPLLRARKNIPAECSLSATARAPDQRSSCSAIRGDWLAVDPRDRRASYDLLLHRGRRVGTKRTTG